MAAAAKKNPTEINHVHQTAILCETIKKEQKNHKIYTSYSINPFKKSMFIVIIRRESLLKNQTSPPNKNVLL